jgi:glucokinase
VSFEQVCSGPGLLNIHRFLSTRATAFPAQSPEQVAANAATCPVAREALETFADIYGSFAGDLALLTGATGGVWLAGGIAAKLQDVLQSRFRAAFEDKPPREHLLRPIGIRLITHPEPGLLGAGAVLSERL